MLARLRHPSTLLATGFLVLAGLFVATLLISDAQRRDVARVEHTLAVENRLALLHVTLGEAESGQRGFIITGDPRYLERYVGAVASIGPDFDRLAALTTDNPRQKAALTRLRPLVEARIDRLRRGVELRKREGFAPAADAVVKGRGFALMSAVHAEIEVMRAEEERLLAERQRQADVTSGRLRLALLAGFLGVLALMVVSVIESNRRLALVAASRDRLAELNAQLVTEAASRERAEAQVRQMQKMEAVGQLTGGIAHDFNNMLSVVIGSLELARRRLRKEPDRAEAGIDNAMEGAQRAAGLTARLLAFSRQQPLAPVAVDPNKLVAGMSELLRRTIGERLQMETVLAGGVWRVNADVPQLENAVLNLCVNARDAMPDGGRLTIETSNAFLDEAYAAQHDEVGAGQYVMISVTDTGVGMGPEVVQRAFDPFYTTKGVGKGTGLGLSQVFGFVKQSGGHVKIYSEVGQGTSVKIYLPRLVGAAASGPTAAPEAALPVAEGTEIILVVEDDETVRHVTVDSLRDLGYTVVQAASGEEAFEMLAVQPRIHLLFTDIVMPGMTGRTLADRALEKRPDLKVLYTTGYTRNAVVHNGVLDAGVAFLPKPFTIDQLAAKVRQVLDGRGANRT